MHIKIASGDIFENEAMVSIKKEGDGRIIKMRNGQLILLPEDRYHWTMKISGHMVEINPELAVNVKNIICIIPNQNGFLVSFDIEPPAEITKEQALLLLNQDEKEKYFLVLDLEKRIEMLIEEGKKSDDYNKI